MNNSQLGEVTKASVPIADTINAVRASASTLQQRVHYLSALSYGDLRQEFCQTKSNGHDAVPPPAAPEDAVAEALAKSLESIIEATATANKLIQELQRNYQGMRLV